MCNTALQCIGIKECLISIKTHKENKLKTEEDMDYTMKKDIVLLCTPTKNKKRGH